FGNFSDVHLTVLFCQSVRQYLKQINIFLDTSAEFLFKLGQKFNIEFVIDRVKKFLMNTKGWCNARKLQFAEKYSLSDLHDHCFDKLITLQDFVDLKASYFYYDLPFKMKAEL
ncbi:hypothetical protein PMAYCL1PPCAC_24839, partial [Pristionchus mayeri]